MNYAIFADWSLNSFLDNLKNSGSYWGALIVTIIGIAAVVIAVFQIVKGFASGGRSQTNWAFVILLFIFGGAMMVTGLGGWTLLQNIANGSNNTINQLGSTILPFLIR